MKQLMYNSPAILKYMEDELGLKFPPGAVAFGTVGNDIAPTSTILGGVVFEGYRPGGSILVHVASTSKFWVTRPLIWATFDYAFNQCKVKKMIGIIDADNEPARKFTETTGFTLEHTIKEAGIGAKDIVIYSLHVDDCRFLEDPRFQPESFGTRLVGAA